MGLDTGRARFMSPSSSGSSGCGVQIVETVSLKLPKPRPPGAEAARVMIFVIEDSSIMETPSLKVERSRCNEKSRSSFLNTSRHWQVQQANPKQLHATMI